MDKAGKWNVVFGEEKKFHFHVPGDIYFQRINFFFILKIRKLNVRMRINLREMRGNHVANGIYIEGRRLALLQLFSLYSLHFIYKRLEWF